ncbi:hypothetical protein [Roseibium aggregatum]|uniref:Uncharacterized protein n=1 Tax=Roseibium aggregatum TaxID=187304 RepID=A0A939J1C1_9HYPH|nr:hypothetical protein [Roseibium aggregatum]MBN9671981.1 hypothetical protein [Roseibium aggregatum]
MDEAVPYEEIALALANHIHDNWYCEEPLSAGQPPVKMLDCASESALQRAAIILAGLKLMEPIGESGSRYVFSCPAEEFEAVIARNKDQGCDYDSLVVAVIQLCEHAAFKKELLDCLVRLELCTYSSSHFDPGRMPPPGVPPEVLNMVRQLPRFEIVWAEKKKYYDDLAQDWASARQ